MAVAITCMECGFIYGFQDEPIEYAGFTCPQCQTTAPKVEVEIDEHPARTTPTAADVAAMKSRAASHFEPHSIAREPVARNADQLDILLALWIAESQVAGELVA